MQDKTILIVDDSPTDLKLMTAPLEASGYRILTAADGEGALEMVVNHRPDLIVLDVILPKMNGFQVCRQIKGSEDTQGIKVIMLTNKTQESDRYWGMKQGADEYLTKPFEDSELLANVARLI